MTLQNLEGSFKLEDDFSDFTTAPSCSCPPVLCFLSILIDHFSSHPSFSPKFLAFRIPFPIHSGSQSIYKYNSTKKNKPNTYMEYMHLCFFKKIMLSSFVLEKNLQMCTHINCGFKSCALLKLF